MLRQAIKCSAAAAAIGGGSYVYLYKQHQVGMVPKNTTYALDRRLAIPSRSHNIERMKKENFDLVIIGGGATGAGVAMDAATRGLKCALVEGDDFSSGTSSRSTKLLHGGVRYLEAAFKKLDVGQLMLVWEALEERAHLLKCAPYMSRPVPIVMPIYQLWQVPYCWLGVRVYDLLAKLVTCFDTGVPDCFYISKENSKFFFPHLRPDGLKGSLVYYDGQHNDARMNMILALNSSIPDYVEGMEPAAVANHCKVLNILKDEKGKAVGARVYDKVRQEEFEVFAKTVVNCTGPASDTVRKMADPNVRPLVAQAAGCHVVLPKFYAPSGFGMIIAQTSDGRVLFFLPWEENVIVGTTDEPAELTELPVPTEKEIDFLLREAAKYINCDYEQIRKDVKSAWSGLRPLVKDPKVPDGEGTAQLSRSHEIVEDPNGLISVMGGKWTTYRRMAQDALDYIIAKNKGVIEPKGPCRTKQMRLYPSIDPTGVHNPKDCDSVSGFLPRELSEEFGLSHSQVRFEPTVCELGKQSNTLVPVQVDQPFMKAEILYSIRHEMAQTCADVLGRRVRVAFVDTDSAKRIVNEVCDIMASELNWSSAQREAEIVDTMKYLDTLNLQQKFSNNSTQVASCPIIKKPAV